MVSLWSSSMTLAIGSPAAVGSIPLVLVALMTVLALVVANAAGAEHLSGSGRRIIQHQMSTK